MRLRVCTGPVDGRGFYVISINYLRYFCELFMLFAQKNRTTIYDVRPTQGLGCWTEGLTNARGGMFDLVHTGVRCGWARRCGPTRSLGCRQGFLYHLEAYGFQYTFLYILYI
jgi:hypothetical protein